MLVHGEEALLAVGFIFTIHFFNGHLRPEKFPMDTVIFTGRGHGEGAGGRAPGRIRAADARRAASTSSPSPAAPRWVYRLGRTVGGTAVVLGLLMVALILFAVLI